MSPAHRLREIREALSLSQDELALRLGVDQSTLSRLEGGRRLPTLLQAIRLEREFGIPCSAWEHGAIDPTTDKRLREILELVKEAKA